MFQLSFLTLDHLSGEKKVVKWETMDSLFSFSGSQNMLTELNYFSLMWKAVQKATFLLLYTAQKWFLLLQWWHKIYFWSLLVDMQMYPVYHKQKLIKSCWNAIVLSPRNTGNNISHHSSAFPFANIVKSHIPCSLPEVSIEIFHLLF